MAANANANANATKDKKEKRLTVAVSITPELMAQVQEYRWANRINTTGEVLRVALEKLVAGTTAGE